LALKSLGRIEVLSGDIHLTSIRLRPRLLNNCSKKEH